MSVCRTQTRKVVPLARVFPNGSGKPTSAANILLFVDVPCNRIDCTVSVGDQGSGTAGYRIASGLGTNDSFWYKQPAVITRQLAIDESQAGDACDFALMQPVDGVTVPNAVITTSLPDSFLITGSMIRRWLFNISLSNLSTIGTGPNPGAINAFVEFEAGQNTNMSPREWLYWKTLCSARLGSTLSDVQAAT